MLLNPTGQMTSVEIFVLESEPKEVSDIGTRNVPVRGFWRMIVWWYSPILG